jgi:glycerol-3-phosphate dehydrogenase
MEEEVDFILEHATQYLTGDPTRDDIQSVFAGLRPLVNTSGSKDTAEISRDHSLLVSLSGLVTIAGGKWTTYRKMAEETIDKAATVAGLNEQDCITEDLRIHGWLKNVDREEHLHYYGSDQVAVEKIIENNPKMGESLHERLPYLKAEVIWAVRNEMAVTVEDVLSRRTRALLLDAEASIEMAPEVARLMADEAGHDEQWQKQQVEEYTQIAQNYIFS